MQFESIMRELGLVEPRRVAVQKRDLARRFHYRPVRRPDKRLDRLSRPVTVQSFPRQEAEWEALYAALWSSSMETVAEACRLPFHTITRRLTQASPFAPRRDW